MRLWSTPESVRQGEPTVLAIIETLAAMAASVWIAVHFGTWKHVLIGFCVAPFLLLRTDASCEQAVHWFDDFISKMHRSGWRLSFPISMTWFLIGGPIVRVAATLVYFFREPKACLASIAANWWRMVCATDFAIS